METTIDVQKRQGVVIVTCAGEITIEVTPDLKRQVEQAGSQDFNSMVLDLSNVSFMDSSGIGSLVAMNTRIRNMGKGFYLFRLSDQVRKTLDLVQLLGFFEVIDSEQGLELLLSE